MYKKYTFKHTQTTCRLVLEAKDPKHAKDLLGGIVGMPEKFILESTEVLSEEEEQC